MLCELVWKSFVSNWDIHEKLTISRKFFTAKKFRNAKSFRLLVLTGFDEIACDDKKIKSIGT